jgi:Trypsin-co-occurring domain 2
MVVVVDIELGDAVAVVREELLASAARGAGGEVGFVVGPIELEFSVELRAEARAKAGFKAWVVSGDVEAGGSRARTHRVAVTLTPKRADGGDLLISDASGSLVGRGEGVARQGR